MSGPQAAEYASVLGRIRTWPAELRLTLAEELLGSLRAELGANGHRGVPAEQVRGLGAGKGPPPDDDTVRRWVEEHQLEKYG